MTILIFIILMGIYRGDSPPQHQPMKYPFGKNNCIFKAPIDNEEWIKNIFKILMNRKITKLTTDY